MDSVTLTNLRVESNLCMNIHGAIYITKGAGTPMAITDIVLFNNTATLLGAGMLIQNVETPITI